MVVTPMPKWFAGSIPARVFELNQYYLFGKGITMASQVELNIVCGNMRIRAKVNPSARPHLNDLLYNIGIDYTNRMDNYIDIHLDDAKCNPLAQITRWIERAQSSQIPYKQRA